MSVSFVILQILNKFEGKEKRREKRHRGKYRQLHNYNFVKKLHTQETCTHWSTAKCHEVTQLDLAAKAPHDVSSHREGLACMPAKSLQSRPTLGTLWTVYGVLREENEWAAISYSRGSSRPGIKPTSLTSALAGRHLIHLSGSQKWIRCWAVAGDPLPKGKGLVEKAFFKPFKTNNTVKEPDHTR